MRRAGAPSESSCLACDGRLSAEPILRGPDRLLGTPGTFEVRECTQCGGGVTFPLLAEAELEPLYAGAYAPYELPRRPLERLASALVRGLQRRRALASAPLDALRERPPGRALDVGCGRGDLGAALIARGWSVTGIDPSPEACAAARRQGLDARAGTVSKLRLEPGAYEVAILQHSLEHLPDPVADLRSIADALGDNALLLVTVPNFGSWQRRRFGSRWFHLDLPRHRVHFTGESLATAIEGAGFELERVSLSTSGIGLQASLQYALLGRLLFRHGLAFRVAAALAAALYPLARLVDRLAGDGDQLHVVARKRRPELTAAPAGGRAA